MPLLRRNAVWKKPFPHRYVIKKTYKNTFVANLKPFSTEMITLIFVVSDLEIVPSKL